MNKFKPNFLFIMGDEIRFPPKYENDQIKKWRKKYLVAENQLRKYGFEFLNHYTGSTACSPARATLFTGHYPSLHGVTQTTGVAKSAFDPDVFWLDPNTVPTMGEYFRCGGYRTFYRGKWHISDEDILIPGTKNPLPSYDPSTGTPDPTNTKIYKNANRLNKFGWDGWIGPEPHGADPRNSGSSAARGLSGRDIVYTEEIIDLINELNESKDDKPWFIVASLVNSHDITLFNEIFKNDPNFNFTIDESVPQIPQAPTAQEDLSTKPDVQEDYKQKYHSGLGLTIDNQEYRRLYYSLNLETDRNMKKILKALKKSRFFDTTIIIFTSDHGDYLGAHGLFQKWYTAYEEAIHIPFIIKLPEHIKLSKKNTSELTSSVDVLPTLLKLANIDIDRIQKQLKTDHKEVRPLVGRDLSPLVLGINSQIKEPIFFMTHDDVLRGLNQKDILGNPYAAVSQPSHIHTIITKIKDKNNKTKIYKLSKYFDDPNFWSNPNIKDIQPLIHNSTTIKGSKFDLLASTVKTKTVPDQFEMYNLTDDPFEQKNLAHPKFATNDSKKIQQLLFDMLLEQIQSKLIKPKQTN